MFYVFGDFLILLIYSSLFKEKTGYTPLQYLTEKRMENAKHLLSSSDLHYSISEIAELCGFEDIYYFSRVFKKNVGLSPTQWLKQKTKKD